MKRGELKTWHRIAWGWGVPLHVAQSALSSRQFSELAAWLNVSDAETTRADWNAAAIQQTIAQAWTGKARALKTYLVKFVTAAGKPKAISANHKSAIRGWLGRARKVAERRRVKDGS